MSFWLLIGGSVVASWTLTRGRRVDAWNRFFWGVLAGIGLWLLWLGLLPVPAR